MLIILSLRFECCSKSVDFDKRYFFHVASCPILSFDFGKGHVQKKVALRDTAKN